MMFLEAIKAMLDLGDKPADTVPTYPFEAPENVKLPYRVLLPQPGSNSDDTETRGNDDVVQVSAFAKSASDASAALNAFTDWAEGKDRFANLADGPTVVLTPNAPRVFRDPSGCYHATADLTARMERARPR